LAKESRHSCGTSESSGSSIASARICVRVGPKEIAAPSIRREPHKEGGLVDEHPPAETHGACGPKAGRVLKQKVAHPPDGERGVAFAELRNGEQDGSLFGSDCLEAIVIHGRSMVSRAANCGLTSPVGDQGVARRIESHRDREWQLLG
jgi:hypothetical protein